MNYLAWFLIVSGAIAVLWAIYKMFEPSCCQDAKPTYSDTLFRGAKQCHNCLHHSISPEHPLLACGQRGVKVEPHHFCDEWA